MPIQIAYCMHRGDTPSQQDALLVDNTVYQSADLLPCKTNLGMDVMVAIADGVATSPQAQLASKLVLKTLAAALVQRPEDCVEGLLSARHIRWTQARLSAVLSVNRATRGASSTVVAVHLKDGHAVVLNVGDSRAYLRTAAGSVRQLSQDHTELQRLRDSGEADASTHYASIYNALSDCLVADPQESEFDIHRETVRLVPGMLFVLCSDGVHDVLGEPIWQALISENYEPFALVEATRAAVLKAGALDNFSIIALLSKMPDGDALALGGTLPFT